MPSSSQNLNSPPQEMESSARRRIYFMRHAQAGYHNPHGVLGTETDAAQLTEEGMSQAVMLANVLKDVRFDRVICSGLPRTVQTARAIFVDREHPQLELDPRFTEIKGGNLADLTQSSDCWERNVSNPWHSASESGARFLGGETFEDFERRVIPAFEDVLFDRNWIQLLLIAHGGVNRVIMNYVLGLRWSSSVSIDQDSACVNIVDVDSREGPSPFIFLLRAVNLTAHNLAKNNIVLTDMERFARQLSLEKKKRDKID